jgi:hypothetical protein
MSHWVAIATTAENDILAHHESLSVLESACGGDFRVISKIYGITDDEMEQLNLGNHKFKLTYLDPRTTVFTNTDDRDSKLDMLSSIIQARLALLLELHQRLEHGYKRFAQVVPWQWDSYKIKEEQAIRVIEDQPGDIGLIVDEANIRKIDPKTVANLVKAKADNMKYQIRKLERLRISMQEEIRFARDREQFMEIKSKLTEETFLSMLM